MGHLSEKKVLPKIAIKVEAKYNSKNWLQLKRNSKCQLARKWEIAQVGE